MEKQRFCDSGLRFGDQNKVSYDCQTLLFVAVVSRLACYLYTVDRSKVETAISYNGYYAADFLRAALAEVGG